MNEGLTGLERHNIFGWTNPLKGSCDVAKKNIILYIWCNAMCLCGLRLKKHIIFHILYSVCTQSSSFWEARRALIGQLSSALWLVEYLKRETEMLRPSPYCDACPGATRLKQ